MTTFVTGLIHMHLSTNPERMKGTQYIYLRLKDHLFRNVVNTILKQLDTPNGPMKLPQTLDFPG